MITGKQVNGFVKKILLLVTGLRKILQRCAKRFIKVINMVKLALHSIAYEAKTLNLAKAGYTAFYVDAATGSDAHDGGSWGQAFKTIQHAIDEAESWCKIFVKEGTYAENITIAKDHVQLIGNDKSTTIVSPATGHAFTVNASDCSIREFKGIVNEITAVGFVLIGDHNEIHDCFVESTIGFNLCVGCSLIGDYCKAYNIYNTGAIYAGLYTDGEYNEIYGCVMNGAYTGIQINGDRVKIHNNEFRNCKAGGKGVDAQGDYNSIYHNNFISNNKSTEDTGTGNKWFENHFNDHTTDTNNDGMADSSRTEDGATDYQPVSRRNGWNQESLGNVASSSTVVGKTQVKTISVTVAANAAADTTLGTVTTQSCIIQGIVIHADAAQTADLTSCPVHGGASKVLTFISSTDAIQANLDAENKQIGWDGEVYLPTGSTIVMVHNGSGATALDLTATIRYISVANGGYLA